jgi:hypothetical protein
VAAQAGLVVLADKGYAGAGDHVRIPYRGRGKPASQKDDNRAHAQLRGPGERANAQLKTWRILPKLRVCPWRAGQLAKAWSSPCKHGSWGRRVNRPAAETFAVTWSQPA